MDPAPTSLSKLDLDGRRLIIRADFDVPLTPAHGIEDATRLQLALPTIEHAVQHGARVIIAAHLGQANGQRTPEDSLEPVGAYLADRLGQEVMLTDEPVGDGVRKVVADLRPGGVALLENVRFDAGEKANDERFARQMAGYADVFVNEAFSTCHLPHASIVTVPRLVQACGIGFLCEREIAAMDNLIGEVARPFYAVLGGNRFAERIPLLESLLDRVDGFVFGGALANTFLTAGGATLGRSLADTQKLPWARAFIEKARHRDVTIVLPRDLTVAAGTRASSGRIVSAKAVPDDLAALDIGPDSAAAYGDILSRARSVYWNGSLGVAEVEAFATGTVTVARGLGDVFGMTSVVTGRTTATALRRSGITDRLTHVSDAGDASAEYLRTGDLVGLAALRRSTPPSN